MNELGKDRLKKYKDGLIVFLLLSLLIIASVSVTSIIDANRNQTRYSLLKEENKGLVEKLERSITAERSLVITPIENRLFTVEERVQLADQKLAFLEQRIDRLEKSLK